MSIVLPRRATALQISTLYYLVSIEALFETKSRLPMLAPCLNAPVRYWRTPSLDLLVALELSLGVNDAADASSLVREVVQTNSRTRLFAPRARSQAAPYRHPGHAHSPLAPHWN